MDSTASTAKYAKTMTDCQACIATPRGLESGPAMRGAGLREYNGALTFVALFLFQIGPHALGFDAEGLEYERVQVGLFLDLLGGRFAAAVARARLHAQQVG